MEKYRVVYTYSKCEEDWIDANSFEEAKEKWENEGYDAELFFIEDEEGNQIIYN